MINFLKNTKRQFLSIFELVRFFIIQNFDPVIFWRNSNSLYSNWKNWTSSYKIKIDKRWQGGFRGHTTFWGSESV